MAFKHPLEHARGKDICIEIGVVEVIRITIQNYHIISGKYPIIKIAGNINNSLILDISSSFKFLLSLELHYDELIRYFFL